MGTKTKSKKKELRAVKAKMFAAVKHGGCKVVGFHEQRFKCQRNVHALQTAELWPTKTESGES